MTSSDSRRLLPRLLADWQTGPARAVGAFAAALGCLLAGLLGGFSLADMPWSTMGPAAGVVLAGLVRWGPGSAAGAALGAALALLAQPLPPLEIGISLVALAAGLALAWRLLGQVGFERRLERARDVGWLVAALAGVFAPVAAAVATSALRWTTLHPLVDRVGPLVAAWATLSIGALLTAFPLLALDRRALFVLERAPRLASAAALAGGAAFATALLCVPANQVGQLGGLLPFVPPLLLVALAVRHGAPLAAAALLLCATAGALACASGAPWWAGAVQPAPLATGAWLATLSALLLMLHAGAVEARWREQRWEWALDGSRLGVADWHVRRGEGFASTAWRALAPSADAGWTPAVWLRQVHDDDRAGLEAAIAQIDAGQTGRLQLELRMRHEAGWRWRLATLLVIERGTDGRPARILATLADVEDRHEALERQRLSTSLFQHLHEGLLVTDAELRVLEANPAYAEILGVPRDRLLGTVPSLLRPAPDDARARQQRVEMWTALRERGTWRGELDERRADGSLRTLQATISTVPGTDRRLSHHVLIISDITEQRHQREQLERQALYDELTRLPNRAHLSTLLTEAMATADRDGFMVAVCYLDLDHFKPVNDRFGHDAGDRLLVELASRLRNTLRRRDRWADVAARLHGDEFVLLLRAGSIDEARRAIVRVLRVLTQPYLVDPEADPVPITASMGATLYPLDHSDPETLLRHADHAMYDAKQSGRNGYVLFDPASRQEREAQALAQDEIEQALDRGELMLRYQPKVDMRSGRVIGFEALLRWEHPTKGELPPHSFLPRIEEDRLLVRVGDWVLSQALEHLAQWRRDGLDFAVGVNVSARHLRREDFAAQLAALIGRHGHDLAPYLELEVVETAAIAAEDSPTTSEQMRLCRELGVRFALDDFGTGYSPLRYLKDLPADTLKIDRSFVHHMLDDAQDRGIVEGIISLARTFGCSVVAEGVETPAQARMLLDLGCDIGQGTGIASPLRAEQVAQWVREFRGVFVIAPAPGEALARLGG
ncbi:GGDEF domain-containing protein [Rubrivivax gelatinosus]|uniref:GGDEF domain-containing protein n=2 Tax=Rubrivivax gelatinosus TaxID=28068 RepID=A0ABS1DU89_RUBGE|nr:GGDEF domain-containing protein [Rubrivivax gelatinosus]MBK1712939.1 GGDEF domain-containing protein [Rubrivivax gelatinosus]